tara:strand:- start:440 stop:781 length:342 start_codon:yes stop_codon:yes gene_type:complete
MNDNYNEEEVKSCVAVVYYSVAGGNVWKSAKLIKESDLMNLAIKTAKTFKANYCIKKKQEYPVYLYDTTAFDLDLDYDIYYQGGVSQGGTLGNGTQKRNAVWATHFKTTHVII